jgi:hypothetical protein
MSPSPSLQTTGRRVEGRHRTWWSATTAMLVAAAMAMTATAAVAAEALSPVKLGEAPLFERDTPLGPVRYVPGRGLHVGNTGLTIGGWASVTGAVLQGGDAEAEIQDLSFFVIWDPVPRLHVFSELEYSDPVRIDRRGHLSDDENSLTADRLFADLRLSDVASIRAGIFRTPVGRWNVIHAAPLVWTTEQPLSTELPFDPNVNGLMLFGSLFNRGGVLSYSLWDQYAAPLEGDPEFKPADHSAGGRLEYTADAGWSVGASYLAARREGDWRHLGGLDLLWNYGRFEVMSELVVEAGAGGAAQGGGYLQGVAGITDRWFLVGRFEHYTRAATHFEIGTLGVAFRPIPAVVLKAEYVFTNQSSDEVERGFHASIATLF